MPEPSQSHTEREKREAKAREILQRAAGAMFLVGSAEGPRIVASGPPSSSESADGDESGD